MEERERERERMYFYFLLLCLQLEGSSGKEAKTSDNHQCQDPHQDQTEVHRLLH